MNDELIEKIKKEWHDLEAKIFHLSCFMDGKKYQALSAEHRQLLVAQIGAMRAYESILITRIMLLGKEEDNNND